MGGRHDGVVHRPVITSLGLESQLWAKESFHVFSLSAHSCLDPSVPQTRQHKVGAAIGEERKQVPYLTCWRVCGGGRNGRRLLFSFSPS